LDALLGLTFLSESTLVEGILLLAVLGAAASLGLRRPVEKEKHASAA